MDASWCGGIDVYYNGFSVVAVIFLSFKIWLCSNVCYILCQNNKKDWDCNFAGFEWNPDTAEMFSNLSL